MLLLFDLIDVLTWKVLLHGGRALEGNGVGGSSGMCCFNTWHGTAEEERACGGGIELRTHRKGNKLIAQITESAAELTRCRPTFTTAIHVSFSSACVF